MHYSPEMSSYAVWKPQMPNVFFRFFIPVFRASDIHGKMGDDAKWTHAHNYPSRPRSSVVKTSYLSWASWGLKNLSPGTHSAAPSLSFLAGGYLHRSASYQGIYIMQKSGGNLVPGATCTVWRLVVMLDSLRPVKPLVKSTQARTLGIWGNHEMFSPREQGQVAYHPRSDPKFKQDNGDKTSSPVWTWLRRSRESARVPPSAHNWIVSFFLQTFQR